MKKVMTLLKVAVVIFTLFVVITVGTFAYYEYYGKYSSIININGTIKLDAFDVLYPDLREDHTYGVTPENPYVIDNVARLQNLIQLNNAGKLKKYKNTLGVDKFYFCLEFDSQDIPQVLNLLNEGLFDPIGNNEYPFEDELAGIVYGYELTSGNIVYLSGCLPQVELKIVDGNVEVNGVVDTSVNAADYTDGTYLKADFMYNASTFVPNNPESVVFDHTTGTTYIKLEDVTPIHQVIANETVAASTDLVDIGFVSKIATNGYVHDIILYNTSISCNEDVKGDTHSALKELFASLTGHHFADADNHSDERHIGIFAGHIDGAASNISVAGTSTVNINTPEVNYYSNYMTVGYIYDYATIGGVTFSELSQDSFLDGGSVSGCLFADDIYASVANDAQATTADGATHYALVNVSQNTEHNWPGVVNGKFSYGSFVFLLSSQDDTVSKIWNGNNAYKLLNDQNYTITGSVLFCADEYRYSPDQQAGGSIIPSSASVKEMLFSGISSLKATGSVIDAGKYLIVAKVEDASRDGGYAYYALKLKASDDGTGNPVYSIDNSFSADVTNFITGTASLYQSALWNVDVASTTPIFENCRYEDIWLTRDHTTVSYGEYNNNQDNYKFQYSAGNNHLYFNETSGETTNQYYLAFDASTITWSMTDNINNAATIEMYHVANGYDLNLVTSMADIEENGDYVIVARNENNSYLLGIDYTDGVVSNKFASTDKTYLTEEFPVNVELSVYEAMRNYVWNVQTVNGNSASFVDKASLTYFLTTNEGALSLSTGEDEWTYNQLTEGGSLVNDAKYLSYVYNAASTTTNFTTSNSAYNLYLYRLVPQDNTPLYITYEGAKYIDADASTIDAGTYAIIGKNGNNYYALGLYDNNIVSTSATTSVNTTSNLDDNYQWTVAEQTSTPTFRNVDSTGRFLNHNGTTLNSATTAVTWMYDAQEHRVYYKNGDTTYYLVTNNTGEFSLQSSLGVDGYSYEVCLYKCLVQHQFTGVSLATGFNADYYYLVSYADLSDTTKSQFLVGYAYKIVLDEQGNETSGINKDALEISNKYKINPENTVITTTSSATITTTEELFNYVWRFRSKSVDWSYQNNNYTGVYGFLYNYGYHVDNSIGEAEENWNDDIYLAASSTTGSRSLIISTSGIHAADDDPASGFIINTGTVNYSVKIDESTTETRSFDGIRIGFRGRGRSYFLLSDTIAGEFRFNDKTNTNSGNGVSRTNIDNITTGVTSATYTDFGIVGNETYLPTYIYQATGKNDVKVLIPVSSNGDPLEEDIHYMITAECGGQYYALALENGDNPSFYSELVTTQVEQIMSYPNGYKGSTTVPRSADWTQKSTSAELRFYHTITSSTGEYNFISRSGSSFTMDSRSVTAGYSDVSQFYYDIVNKVLKVDVDSENDANTYYVTFDANAKTFGLSNSLSDAASIHLMRYTPTYKVEVVNDFYNDLSQETLKNGNFIIAGHSVDGYFAIGTTGINVVLAYNITNYLNENLSEEDYNSILQCIFKQVYYDNSTDNYDTHANGGYVELQLLSLAGTGSFGAMGSGGSSNSANLTTFSSAYKWKITKTEDGLWRFVNDTKVGLTGAGDFGILFNQGNGSASLVLNDSVAEIGSYAGEFDMVKIFDNVSSNIYLYSPTTGQRYTETVTNGANYLIVAEASGYKFVISNVNGNIVVTNVNDAQLSSLSDDSNCLWITTAFEDGYSITNNGYYAYVDANGTILAQNSNLKGYFTFASGKISYVPFTDYYLYTNGTTTVTVGTSNNYWTKICRYSIDGTDYKFSPVTTAQISQDATNLVLISYDNNKYYLLNIGGTNIARNEVEKSGDNYYIAQTSVNIFQYIVEVESQGNGQYQIRSRNTIYMYSTSNTAYGRTSEMNMWTKIYRYELEGNTYTFRQATIEDFSTYSTKLVLISRNDKNYYLHDIRTNTRARLALSEPDSNGVITQTDVAISNYVVEVTNTETGQYNVRAATISHMYSSGGTAFNVSNGDTRWTKIYRYEIDGNNYRFYPVDSSEFGDYEGKLVLISNNNGTYYIIRTNNTTIARTQVASSTNGTFTLATTNAIRQYLVDVSNNGSNNYTITGTQVTDYYRYGNNLGSTRNSASNTYHTKLYTYTLNNNGRATFTALSDINNYANQDVVLITRNNNYYYIITIGTNGITTTQVSNNLRMDNFNATNYLVTVNKENGMYSIKGTASNKYLNMSTSGVGVSNDPVYFDYNSTGGFYYSTITGTVYVRCDGSYRRLQTDSATVSYTDAHGIYYAGGTGTYYYLRFNASNADTANSTQTISYSYNNGVYYNGEYHYLRCTSTNRDTTTNATSVTYRDYNGVYYRTTQTIVPGLVCSSGFASVTEENNGSMIVVYKYENGTYTQVKDDFEAGSQYVIFYRGSDNIYHIIGYSVDHALLVLTEVGTELTGFENLVTAENYINAVASGSVVGTALQFNVNQTKYLTVSNGQIVAGASGTNWEYYWNDIYTDQSRLYTVSTNNVSKVLTANGNRIVPQVSGAETYLFNYEASEAGNGLYTITSILEESPTSGNSYVIVIYQDSKYYIVSNNDGEIVPVSSGSGFPSTITSNMLWTYNSDNYFKPYVDSGNTYLRTGRNGALTLSTDYVGSSWTYTATASSASNKPGFNEETTYRGTPTPVYIFKVSMNDSLDAISDTYTTLKGKSVVSASLSVLSSSNYVITAAYNGKVYALAMKNLQESTALDITETFREASNGGYIRLFSSSVWNQVGTDYNLIFDSLGFRGNNVNLLSGSRENLFEDSPTVIQMDNMPENDEPYIWTLYTYGDDNYVLGNYDSGYQNTSFIYFDYNDLMFKVTQNESLAKTTGNKVSIYQLGAEVAGGDRIDFQTFMIDMKADGVTIKSYPLAEEEPKNITTFSSSVSTDGTLTGVISGEYLIAAKIGEKYYALTLDYSGNIAMSDISLLFLGNFEQDGAGKYCISINTRYLWKQTGTPVYDASTGVASGLTFANYAKGTNLDLNGTTLLFGNGQLYSTANQTTTYLAFSETDGFSLSNSPSNVDIILYSVGAGSVVSGDNSQELSYSYYSSALNTAAVDFSDFAFKKMQIPDLLTYAKDEEGILKTTAGWNLTSTTYLETVTSSVYFKDGIAYSTNIDTFASEFSQIESSFNITDEETQEVSTFTVNYYAPKGVVAFVIPDASSDMPTFINIIASTQQDEAYSSDVARYLAIWKMADLENNTLVPITTANGGASDYAATLINKFYKPDNAIPLPNHTGSVASGASYVKVEDGENNYLDYNLSTDANHNHLIGHTFCITSPGVYYIGSTYGTVTISYLSIGNMIAAEEGEVNENVIDSGFSIDFVWGEVPSSATGVDFGDDEGVGSITYVNRLTENDESRTWVHSNIYPKFINGTSGLYEDTKPDDYNPTDYLVITVRRDYTTSESTEYSTVHINASTTLAIANEGEGIIYSNANNAYQRVKRKVELHVTCIDAEEEEEPSGD